MDIKKILSYVDHTLLAQNATWDEIKSICDDGIKYNMKDFCNCIENRIVYPILIKNNGRSYLTLYYYTEHSDSILHRDVKKLLYFQSKEKMECFCKINELKIENEVVEYAEKLCNELGYKFMHCTLPADISEVMLIQQIDLLNLNEDVDGIIVQMPLPAHINATRVLNTIDPNKDVDGAHDVNILRLFNNDKDE